MNIGPFQVTYCTNVHPAESLDAVLNTLEHDVASVKGLVCPKSSFGTGLRLSNEAVLSIQNTPSLAGLFHDVLVSRDFQVFTVNGFPYGDFSTGTVKESVYEPSWMEDERVKYTLDLARVLAGLPGPQHRTISTVAGGYRPNTQKPQHHALIAKNLMKAAQGLQTICEKTGVHIRLCVEPEPWTTLETTVDVLRFFVDYLDVTQPLVAEYLGLCYDCCHQAVQFEDPTQSIKDLHSAGIVIGKIQVSSALHLDSPRDAQKRNELMKFVEPRFLHQTVAQTADGLLRCVDLSRLQNPDPQWLNAHAWRCHFHVPIDWRGDSLLKTTRNDWEHAIQTAMALNIHPHCEIETYTWLVLPPHLQPSEEDGLVRAIEREFNALRSVIEAG